MKSDWERKKLGEVCKISPPKKEARILLKDEDFVSFVPMEDLGILSKDFIAKKERQLKDVFGSYTYFSDNDVLLAKITPCFENGKIGVARNLKNKIGFGSSEYIVFRSLGQIIPDYLYYFLARDEFRKMGEKVMSSAVGHKRVPKDFIENQEISFPKSISEQQCIVAILDKAFFGITKAKANAEKNLQNAREIFQSYLQSVFDKTGDGRELKKLGDICIIKHGYAFESKDFKTDFEGNTPIVLTPGNFLEDYKLYFNEKNTKRYIGKYSENYLFNSGDLVVVMTDLSSQMKILGKPAIIEDTNILHNQRIGRIQFNNDSLNKFYLFYYLQTKSYLKKIKETATGTMVRHTAPKRILENTIYFPSYIEQQRIVAKLDELYLETKKLEVLYQKKFTDLEEMKRSILNKAINGELPIAQLETSL